MSDAHDAPSALQSNAANAGPQSIARRRAILKGMGKTAALAGSAVPLSSLATKDRLHIPKTGGNTMCTMSGQNSMIHSAVSTTPCTAKSPVHYQTSSNWPASCNNGTDPFTSATAFWQCFGLSPVITGIRSKSLMYLVTNQSGTEEAHWVAAMVNANKFATTFPYSPAEVKGMYGNSTALKFFRDYLET